MKKSWSILLLLLLYLSGETAWSTCLQDSNDRGNCDTMYIEPWQSDLEQYTPGGGPYFVRVPIYVTSDLADNCDSINAFVIPLCYTHTNPTKYCSVSAYWNVTFNFSTPRSMFRDLDSVSNRMKGLFDQEQGAEWDTRDAWMKSDSSWQVWQVGSPQDHKYDSAFVPPHIWLSFLPSGGEDQRWWEGSRVLLATITFKLEDSMHICMDTCWWPPSSHLAWGVSGVSQESSGVCLIGITKIPRSGTGDSSYQVCFDFGASDVKEVKNSDVIRPEGFSLSQNYPNPFNPTTTFRFTVPKSSHVKIEIFNIVGQKVAVLVDDHMKPGFYTADWNGKDENGRTVASGIYFYRMQADNFSDMKKMVLIK
jgi:hypothetical protein